MFAVHPDVKSHSNVTQPVRNEMNRAMASLVQRLLTQTCLAEARDAIKYEGNSSFEGAFTVLGQVAARELSADPGVNAAMSDFIRYLDAAEMQKIEPNRR